MLLDVTPPLRFHSEGEGQLETLFILPVISQTPSHSHCRASTIKATSRVQAILLLRPISQTNQKQICKYLTNMLKAATLRSLPHCVKRKLVLLTRFASLFILVGREHHQISRTASTHRRTSLQGSSFSRVALLSSHWMGKCITRARRRPH